MKTEFRKDLRNQYLVLSDHESGSENKRYMLNMISENKISMFAKCSIEHLNAEELLYYDVTGKTDLLTYLSVNQADESFFEMLLLGIAEAVENIQEYLLDEDRIILELKYIFMDTLKNSLVFVYYPYGGKNFAQSCKSLSESLLGYIRQDDIKAVKLGYGFYKNCMLGRVTAEALRDMAAGRNMKQDSGETYIEEGLKEERSRYDDKNVNRKYVDHNNNKLNENKHDNNRLYENKNRTLYGSEKYGNEEKRDYSFLFEDNDAGRKNSGGGIFNKLFKGKEKAKKYKEVNLKHSAVYEKKGRYPDYYPDYKEKIQDHKEDTYVNNSTDLDISEHENISMETTFLSASDKTAAVKAWLMPESETSGEGVMLVKDRYVIGKRIAGADIALESKAVSRAHAKLIWQQGLYFIVDLSSKNGTRVNGVKLKDGEKLSLKDGDRIVFADTGCVYKQMFV